MSIDTRPPSITEMRAFVADYLKARVKTDYISQEDFDDETIKEMFTEVNSKYVGGF